MKKDKVLLFVYGTLKKGYSRNSILADEQFIGTAKTTAHYRLFDLGAFPGLTDDGDQSIVGELYEVDSKLIPYLDQIEGVRFGMYRYGTVNLQSVTNKTEDLSDKYSSANTYFFNMDTSSFYECSPEWRG